MKISLPKLALPKLALGGWKRKAAYAGFFAGSFLLALHHTFPVEAVKERIILEAAAQGWQVRMNDVSPSGFVGVRAREVTFQTRDGTRIPVEEVRASLRPWGFLMGRRALAFDAALFDGRLSGLSEQGRTAKRLVMKANGIDLSRVGALQKVTGLKLAGTLAADVDVDIDASDATKNTGKMELTVKNAAIQGGEILLPGLGGALTVPRIALGTLTVRGTVRGARAEFERLEVHGDDVEASAEQLYALLQQRLELSPLAGRARLRLSDGFWARSGAANLKPVVDVALSSAHNRDGTLGFQIYGTLGKPQLRPMAQ